jgi:hypothetical protein
MEKIKAMLSEKQLEYVVFKRYCKICKGLKNIEEYDEFKRGKNTYHRRVCSFCFGATKKKYNRDFYNKKKEKFKKAFMISDSEDILTDSDNTNYTL